MSRWTRAGTLALFFLATSPPEAAGQAAELAFGLGLPSRYVWRGIPLESTAQAQPWVSATFGSFEVGVWGSFGLDGDYKEQNEWVSWTRPLARGSLVLSLTDYYFTENYRDFLDWGGVEDGEATGPHTLEAAASWSGPDEAPFRAMISSTVHNDPRPSVYGEVGYGLEAGRVYWGAEAGWLFRDGGYYEVGGSGMINLALSASALLGRIGPLEAHATGWIIHDPKLHRTFLTLELSVDGGASLGHREPVTRETPPPQ